MIKKLYNFLFIKNKVNIIQNKSSHGEHNDKHLNNLRKIKICPGLENNNNLDQIIDRNSISSNSTINKTSISTKNSIYTSDISSDKNSVLQNINKDIPYNKKKFFLTNFYIKNIKKNKIYYFIVIFYLLLVCIFSLSICIYTVIYNYYKLDINIQQLFFTKSEFIKNIINYYNYNNLLGNIQITNNITEQITQNIENIFIYTNQDTISSALLFFYNNNITNFFINKKNLNNISIIDDIIFLQ